MSEIRSPSEQPGGPCLGQVIQGLAACHQPLTSAHSYHSYNITVITALTALFEFAFVFSERPSKPCARLFLLANDNSD